MRGFVSLIPSSDHFKEDILQPQTLGKVSAVIGNTMQRWFNGNLVLFVYVSIKMTTERAITR